MMMLPNADNVAQVRIYHLAGAYDFLSALSLEELKAFSATRLTVVTSREQIEALLGAVAEATPESGRIDTRWGAEFIDGDDTLMLCVTLDEFHDHGNVGDAPVTFTSRLRAELEYAKSTNGR